MKFLVNIAPSANAFAFCGLDTKAGNNFSKVNNSIISLHVFDTNPIEFCNAIDECIRQRNLNSLDAKGSLSYYDTYEVQVGECMVKRKHSVLSIAAGYREILQVPEVNYLKNLTKEIRKAYKAIDK